MSLFVETVAEHLRNLHEFGAKGRNASPILVGTIRIRIPSLQSISLKTDSPDVATQIE
ncbi:hypothetical protein [Trichocoleus sp. DQ-U1]|uniref:hypothetical protein n=1 Tax=Trichocoleus sp. DQ-U1 TaxID=2933926 RepID=UPI003299561F